MLNPRTTSIALCLAVAAVVTVVVVSSGDDDRAQTTLSTSAATTSSTTVDTIAGGQRRVGFLTDGSVRADDFNDYIVNERPPWAFDPRAAALNLFGISETSAEPTVERTIDVSDNPDGTTTVTITSVGPGDDSTSGTRYSAVFERAADGTVRFVEGTWGHQCIRSESPEAFVPKVCP